MPATARMALSRKARLAGSAAADTPTSDSAALWAELLAEVPLFAGLPARHVRKIARLGRVARFDAKAPIVTAGDRADSFYVVLTGRASVRRGRGRARTEIGSGAYFGEMALLDGAERSATIVAETETLCLILPRQRFTKILKDEPAVALTLLRTLARRVRELEGAPGE